MGDCVVCVEPFTACLKRPVECPYCGVSTCLTCAKKCTLMWCAGPKCAKCDKTFTTENLDAMFNKQFRRGPLRQQRVQSLQEQEMSLLPSTMEFIVQQSAELQRHLAAIEFRNTLAEISANELRDLGPPVTKLYEIQKTLLEIGVHKPEKKEEFRRSVKCPKDSGLDSACMGYIISGRSCGICKTKLCKNCNVILDSGVHECRDDDVKSWQFIKESSVACPKCGTQIQKISGCNQMWCTVSNCNTAFDWATGHIVNGPVHNPHYHDWLRNNGEAVGAEMNIACQGPRDVITNPRAAMIYRIYNVTGPSAEYYKLNPMGAEYSWLKEDTKSLNYRFFSQFNRACLFIRALLEAVDGYYLPVDPRPYSQETYRDLRINYLKKKISKAEWASKMSCRETHREKNQRIFNLHRMFQTAAADIFARFYTDSVKQADGPDGVDNRRNHLTPANRNVALRTVSVSHSIVLVETFVNSLDNLSQYYNKEIFRIYSDYSDKYARILHVDPELIMWSKVKITN